jgi:hypothetical protein
VTILSLTMPARARETAFSRSLWATILRAVAIAFGSLLIVAGIPLALLPLHLGVPLIAVGLVMVLRSSMPARRRFIKLQRRHPKVVFPIRRLLRREPEVFPVAWQQVLRLERTFLPKSWRMARQMRRRLFPNRKRR